MISPKVIGFIDMTSKANETFIIVSLTRQRNHNLNQPILTHNIFLALILSPISDKNLDNSPSVIKRALVIVNKHYESNQRRKTTDL